MKEKKENGKYIMMIDSFAIQIYDTKKKYLLFMYCGGCFGEN